MPDNANPTTTAAVPVANGWTAGKLMTAARWIVCAVVLFASMFSYFVWSQGRQDERIEANSLATVEIRGKIDSLCLEVGEIKRVQMRHEEKLDRILFELRSDGE